MFYLITCCSADIIDKRETAPYRCTIPFISEEDINEDIHNDLSSMTAAEKWDYVYWVRRAAINEVTAAKIAEGFYHPVGNGYLWFSLSEEDQRNYMGLAVFKDYLAYSGDDKILIKGRIGGPTGDVQYFAPASATELMYFCLNGMNTIKKLLAEGWEYKDALDDMTFDEICAWEDPRIESLVSTSSESSLSESSVTETETSISSQSTASESSSSG